MRFLRRSLTGLFLLAVTLALLVWAADMLRQAVMTRMADAPAPPPARERVFSVNVTKAETRTIAPVLTAFGETRSRRQLDVRPAIGGRVASLSENFVDGGSVVKDEVLLQIDTSEAELAMERARSDQMDAEAEVREARRSLTLARDEEVAANEQVALREAALKRQRDLAGRGVGTAASVESAELAAASARAVVLQRRQAVAAAEARVDQAATRLARARIAVAEAKRRLDDHLVRAGFSGTLSEVAAVVEGGLVSPNERLARLVDGGDLEVAFRISTAQYLRLVDGTGALPPAPVKVTLDAYGIAMSAEGVLVRDSGAIGAGKAGRLMFARLNEAPALRPGDLVTVELSEPPLEEVVQLPATALDAVGQVLVIGEGNRLEALAVTLLRRQGDSVLVRAAGLAGRLVVSEITPALGPGVRVRPVERGEAAINTTDEEMVELTEERRARLKALVEANRQMPEAARQRILGQLDRPRVPARMVARIEARTGG